MLTWCYAKKYIFQSAAGKVHQTVRGKDNLCTHFSLIFTEEENTSIHQAVEGNCLLLVLFRLQSTSCCLETTNDEIIYVIWKQWPACLRSCPSGGSDNWKWESIGSFLMDSSNKIIFSLSLSFLGTWHISFTLFPPAPNTLRVDLISFPLAGITSKLESCWRGTNEDSLTLGMVLTQKSPHYPSSLLILPGPQLRHLKASCHRDQAAKTRVRWL